MAQTQTQNKKQTQTPTSPSTPTSHVSIQSRALNEHQITLLVRKLECHLPCSIPLLRRIQSHLQRECASTTARIFVAAVRGDHNASASTRSDPEPPEHEHEHEHEHERVHQWDLDLGAWLNLEPQSQSPDTDTPDPWIAAHIDLVNAGQTQVWVFGSWEAASSTSGNEAASSSSTDTDTDPHPHPHALLHKGLLNALFTYISRHLIPLLPTNPPEEWLSLAATGKYLSRPYSRDKVLFGAVSDKLWHLFPEGARTRTDAGYWKYLFRRDTSSSPTSSTAPLPPGYRFGAMQDAHLQLVLDRTPIPRTLGTLRQLVSIGVFHEEGTVPVGWGFLGKDASLSSLHTEVEHRGRGLAVSLGAELWRRQQEQLQSGQGGKADRAERGGGAVDEVAQEANKTSTSTPPPWWGHADVSQHNGASRRVMEKLGGRPAWMVMWTEMDMRVLLALEE
ncbi:hypothetical protein A1O7_09918 [Cladophialophora yegresii CBS 114405]|uniref:N-acetyltransferase domain-containing protein n=1 Tax=Cladophialophora yegresii CBS 114405 TaxID=1182544 RepID=W9VG16_9EURO|nr:uncharacterized protein A1O7_09918 [Cladophialophora yegresii CBS 114405]EXJ54577.1 hypothetical protein A1O7_09918 [Cladophialophora yegresii CBS 114405]